MRGHSLRVVPRPISDLTSFLQVTTFCLENDLIEIAADLDLLMRELVCGRFSESSNRCIASS